MADAEVVHVNRLLMRPPGKALSPKSVNMSKSMLLVGAELVDCADVHVASRDANELVEHANVGRVLETVFLGLAPPAALEVEIVVAEAVVLSCLVLGC